MTGLAAPSAVLLSLSLCLSIAAMVWPHMTFAQDHRTASRAHPRPAKPRVVAPENARRSTRETHSGSARHGVKRLISRPTTKVKRPPRPHHHQSPKARPSRAARATSPQSRAATARSARTRASTKHKTAQHGRARQHAAHRRHSPDTAAPQVSKSAAAAAALLGATAEARGRVQMTAADHRSGAGPALLSRCGYTPHARHRLQTASIYVRDVRSGKVLLEKNATRVRPIASLSKMMTAVVARDAQRPLSSKLTVTNADLDDIKHTHSRLKVGSTLSRNDMFHIALMSSENRAAAALSRDYPGGRPAFMQAMNAKARALGMRHTHFDNPTGLSPRNISTAVDLAKLVDHAMEDPLLRRFSTDKWSIVHPGHGELVYVNSNRLVRLNHWPVALQKTGFINEAGHSMMMRLDVDGRPITMVLLGAPTPQGDVNDAIMIRRWLTCSLK